MSTGGHVPVLLREVVDAIAPRDGGVYLDGTFGAGGYTKAFLSAGNCTVWAIDRDPSAVATGRALEAQFPNRFHMIQGCFGDMHALMNAHGVSAVDGIALDVGVSSMQIDQAERGFSFREDGPLDMRMGDDGPTAADVVNETPEKELADIIYQLGEERASRAVAKIIVETRDETPFERTKQLAIAVRSVVRKSKDGIDPATRTFQALRIYVNDELGELDRGLIGAQRLLAPEGRLAVVSFHSLEDRRVKAFLRKQSGSTPQPSRHMPTAAPQNDAHQPTPPFRLIGRRPIAADRDETRANPRSRSARLRVAQRTDAPAPPMPEEL